MRGGCRVLRYPERFPVEETKQALEKFTEGELVVLLDEEVAKENVTRLAGSLGYTVQITEKGGEFILTLRRGRGK